MYSDKSFNPQKRLVEMLHSKTPESVKNTVLDSFRRENGLIRILFATVAFGMGVNTKGVRRIKMHSCWSTKELGGLC